MVQDRIDQVVKGYELREQIGEGGYGVVYRAYQPLVGRDVAVKIILPQHANHPDFIRRFEWEAQLVARLEHPYIVPLYDYWRDPDGAFLVMRWLRGGNLHDALHNKPLPAEMLGRLIEQIGGALASAHRRGVVHRDLKPANVLLDEEGNAYLADFGIAKDMGTRISPYQTDASTVVGSPAYISPEQVRAEPITPQTDIYSLGVMLYEILTGQLPFQAPTPIALMFMHVNEPVPTVRAHRPDLSDAVNTVIQRATAKRPADRYPDVTTMMQELRQALASGPAITRRLTDDLPTFGQPENGSRTTSGSATRSKYETGILYLPSQLAEPVETAIENPYKGLRAFQEADADDFFGREMLTQLLLARMQDQSTLGRFLAVVGPSGSGKSSVVRAGVVPALRRGGLPGSQNWFVVEMFPSAHPIEELAQALLRVAVEPPNNLVEPLKLDERGLLRVVDQVVPGDDDTEVVLVIDQFEEVFTLVEDEAVRTHFLDSLIAAVTDPYSRIRVIVTLRADFYDRPLLYPGFSELMRQRTEVVVPLAPEELKQAIVSPAERNGLRVDPELVEAIVSDVGEQPGALPLLQYALTEVFERRSGRTLTLTPYNASGGVLGALARRAEEIYISLTPTQQEAARQLFLRLVTLGEGVEDTRRRVRRTELAFISHREHKAHKPDTNGADPVALAMAEKAALNVVIDIYSQYRLLTLDNDPATRVPTVEVAHEALIRTWTRLRQWLDASRDDLRLQRRLTTAAAEWLASGKERSFLASGARLEQLANWAEETHLALNAEERDYLNASLAERDAQQAQEEARKAHEATLERRSRIFLRALVAVFAVAAVIAAGLSVFAFGQQRIAQTNEQRAEQNAALAQTEAERAEQNAALAQTEAGRAEQNAALAQDRALVSGALAAYYDNNEDLARALARLAVEKPAPVAFAEDTFSNVAYSPGTRHVFTAHEDGVTAVAFSPDETMAVSAAKDEAIILWDLTTYQELGRFEGGHTAEVRQLYFLPDGKQLLTGSVDNTAILWDVATLKPIRTFKRHSGEVRGMALRPNSQQFITGSGDSTLMLWDLNCSTPTPQECDQPIRVFERGNGGHTQEVNQLAFTFDGSKVLSSGQEGDVIIWDVETARPIGALRPEKPFEVRSVVVVPGDQYAISSGNNQNVTLWDLNTQQPVRTFVGHTRLVYDVAVSADGKYALTGSDDNSMMMWDLSDDSRIVRPIEVLHGHGAYVREIVFSKDGHHALTASADKTVRLWDLANGAEILPRRDAQASVGSTAISPDGRYLAAATDSGVAKLWDMTTGQLVHQFRWHARGVKAIAFSPDSKFVLTGGDKRDGAIILSSIETGQIVSPKFDYITFGVNAVAFSPDGKYVVSGHIQPADTDLQNDPSLSPELKEIGMILWDAKTGEIIHKFPEQTGSANALIFSPDGAKIFAVVGAKVVILDIPGGQVLGELEGESGKLNGVDVTADFKTVISGGRDKKFFVWNVETGEKWTSDTLASEITDVAISPDGAYAAATADRKLFIYDLATKQLIRTFSGHTGEVRQLRFAPDGRTLFSGSVDGTVRQWRLDSREEMIAWADTNRTFPTLTCEQQQRYGLESQSC